MNKVVRYVTAYFAWIANLVLALWLAYLCKMDFTNIAALFYKQGDWAYLKAVDFIDRAFTIALGLGWLVFMILVEAYFRAGAAKDDLPRRFASVTGPLMLVMFVVDLILFWTQGAGNAGWLRWLVLAAELGIGTALLVSAKTRFTSTSK
ncbi:MAG: hypothetical protein EHM81_08740 [Chloroflexi bacterium]|nr:MAG: hypothetical protein EHM81_08740 [Chloroflexota bacterium]